MKKHSKFLVALSIMAALVIGFLIGISVDFPKTNNQALSGTIGKVNNYRNVQVSEADITLKNELVTDTTRLKMLQGYFNYYYVRALKLNSDIDMVLKESLAVEPFQATNKSMISNLDNFGKFLLSARTDLLLALSACKSIKEADPVSLRSVLSQGKNIVAQINYRDRIVLDFIDVLAVFIHANSKIKYEGLERAHDLLVVNEMYASLVTKNKVVLKFLDQTALLSKSPMGKNSLDQQKLNTMIQSDLEKLRSTDAEKLGAGDTERLKQYNDVEKLGQAAGDAEKLGVSFYKDVEKLACDTEKLGVTDTEKLGHGHELDVEKLGNGLVLDAEMLGDFPLTGQVQFNPGPTR